jgi:hypothetical protein
VIPVVLMVLMVLMVLVLRLLVVVVVTPAAHGAKIGFCSFCKGRVGLDRGGALLSLDAARAVVEVEGMSIAWAPNGSWL